MTIFLDIAKYFLIDHIKKEKERAEGLNKSWLWSKTRDVQHSKTKINYGIELYKAIFKLTDKANDKETLDAIVDLIREYQELAKKLCDQTGHSLGEFNAAMEGAVSLVMGIHHIFKTNQFAYNVQPQLDPSADPVFDILIQSPSTRYADPLDKILYYAVFYYVKKYQEPKSLTWFGATMRSIFSTTQVSKEKADLVQNTIAALKIALKGTERNRVLHRESRKETTLMCLGAILGENTRVCQTHPFRSTLSPFGATIGGWLDLKLQWECAPGDLKEIMEGARNEILAMGIPEVIIALSEEEPIDGRKETEEDSIDMSSSSAEDQPSSPTEDKKGKKRVTVDKGGPSASKQTEKDGLSEELVHSKSKRQSKTISLSKGSAMFAREQTRELDEGFEEEDEQLDSEDERLQKEKEGSLSKVV